MKHYKWMLDHEDAFFQSWEIEERPLWDGDSKETLVSHRQTVRAEIHACLINAYETAGELDRAIDAARVWIDACPGRLGTLERMARLYQKRADPVTAADYMRKEAEKREALGDKGFGEDPNVSIILALGGIMSASRLDEMLKGIASTHVHEHGVVERIVQNYWSSFSRLNPDDRQRWVTGSLLLAENVPHGPGLAVHCFARVVEGELRRGIFERFAEYARSNPTALAGYPDDLFGRYLQGSDKGLALGQMFRTLSIARRPSSPMISCFAEWLKRDKPWLLAGISRLRTDRIVELRNREAHPDIGTIRTHEAEEASQTCREVINLLYSR